MALNIIFAGTPEFAARHLAALILEKYNIIGVYTQPDRPSGRGQQLSASPVKTLALTHGIPVYQPVSLRNPIEQNILSELKPDLIIVVAYGLILPKAVLSIPRYGCINVHGSLLPRFRGAAPIQHAILAGDNKTGVTIMQMDEGLDTGDMLYKKSCAISLTDTSGTLYEKLATLGTDALLESLALLAQNKLTPEKQNDSEACYASKIEKNQAYVRWKENHAQKIDCMIRAYNPWPIAFTQYQSTTIRIWQARPLPEKTEAKPGTIIDINPSGIKVACAKTSVLLLEVLQLPGKKALPVQQLLTGHPNLFKLNDYFHDE